MSLEWRVGLGFRVGSGLRIRMARQARDQGHRQVDRGGLLDTNRGARLSARVLR